jgi:peptide/nickel transport system permease protein
MISYILRRMLLLPITMFFIILVNFVIINLAPGEPTTVTEISAEGLATRSEGQSVAFGADDRYLQFREHYGLTLPILFNTWPFIHREEVQTTLWRLIHRKEGPDSKEEMSVKNYDDMRIKFGDQARFIMPILLEIIADSRESMETRRMASRFFVRGGTRQSIVGVNLTEAQKAYNRKVSADNQLLESLVFAPEDTPAEIQNKIQEMESWYRANKQFYNFEPSLPVKIREIFLETRFCRYMSRVLTLDFGTMRNDQNKLVINEVSKRFKYSLTLSILPMLITFVLCQLFGFTMAFYQNRLPDVSLNVVFLILYAIPVFVVAPFLIEKIAINHTFPFTKIPIPYSGFTSPESVYANEVSYQRLIDTLQHIFLPIVVIMYGGLALQSRLSRTAVLETLRQDYVRTARAKGLGTLTILGKHVGRNASITIVTAIAGSFGLILGGSLIVETLFDINGFGRFFYEAILNRDYNVIMFSALAGAFLSLIGYLVADIAYTVLDPRVTLE